MELLAGDQVDVMSDVLHAMWTVLDAEPKPTRN